MIKLKEGQKVVAEDGSIYEIEKGDLLETTLTEREDLTKEDFIVQLEDIISDAKKIGWVNIDYDGIHMQLDPKDTKQFSVNYDNVGFWVQHNNSQVYISYKMVKSYGFDPRSTTYVANFSDGYFSFTVY